MGGRIGARVGHTRGEENLAYKSVQRWFERLEESAVGRGKNLTKNARNIRLRVLAEYVEFASLNPDELLSEAKENIENAMRRLTNFFLWLQGEPVKGIKPRKTKIWWNGACTLQAYMRGFYTHNDLVFPKRFRTPKRRISKVSKRDSKTEIYGYDEEKDEIIYRNGFLQHFLSNLSFRDQTIGLCLLSTGADASDLVALNLGFVKDAKGNTSKAKRFLWHDNRVKDGEEFKVFFSEEATQFLKRYVEQERANAKDSDSLFAKEDGERLNAHALAMNFRVASTKMGLAKVNEANPFRPKRFRHLFRTACANAGIDAGFTMSFMGHASNISAGYIEKSNGLFLKEYVRVEPYVTVYGVQKNQVQRINEDLDETKQSLVELYQENKRFDKMLKAFEKRFSVNREDIMSEWQRDHADEGLGGGKSRKPDFGYDDLSEAEKDKYFHRALRRKMLEI